MQEQGPIVAGAAPGVRRAPGSGGQATGQVAASPAAACRPRAPDAGLSVVVVGEQEQAGEGVREGLLKLVGRPAGRVNAHLVREPAGDLLDEVRGELRIVLCGAGHDCNSEAARCAGAPDSRARPAQLHPRVGLRGDLSHPRRGHEREWSDGW